MADSERVKKLVGMLTSDFDGERANAAGFLAAMAKAEKKSLTEFLQSTLGSNRSAYDIYQGSTVRSSWANADAAELSVWKRRFYEIASEKQDALQRAERAERQLAQLREQLRQERAQGFNAEPRGGDSSDREYSGGSRSGRRSRVLLDELYNLAAAAKADDPFYLTAWEVEFIDSVACIMSDILLSARQRSTVERILQKLRKREAEPLI